jgi:hypothetical protein
MLACKTSIDGPRINKLESEERATISLERSVRYKNGLSMVLRNVSSVALWVNARGALNSEGDPAAFREVWLEVNDTKNPPRAPSRVAHLDGLLQSLPMAFDVVP